MEHPCIYTDMNLGIVCDVSRILQKHMKRQIISLIGDFQVIVDLNVYHVFIILQQSIIQLPNLLQTEDVASDSSVPAGDKE